MGLKIIRICDVGGEEVVIEGKELNNFKARSEQKEEIVFINPAFVCFSCGIKHEAAHQIPEETPAT